MLFSIVEIKAGAFGMFQLADDYDSHLTRDGTTTSRQFDFIYAAIMYCDHSKASKDRSSHQIKGKKSVFMKYNLILKYTDC